METMMLDIENLEEIALTRFDQLVSQGKLIYGPSTREIIAHNGFTFEFRIAPALLNKPVLAPDDPGRTKAVGPFVNPDPDFVLTKVGPSHTLELNKFCIFRPQYVLHTNDFQPQTDDVNECDIAAILAVMKALVTPQIVLFNCGVQAGSSQGHKHFQLFPRPSPDEFQLFPDVIKRLAHHFVAQPPVSMKSVPYKHYIRAFRGMDCLAEHQPSASIFAIYLQLLQKTRAALSKIESRSSAYDMVMAKDWMMLIPRTSQGKNFIGTNGAGMMGMVWLQDQRERDCWTEYGMTEYLAYLGIPKQDNTGMFDDPNHNIVLL